MPNAGWSPAAPEASPPVLRCRVERPGEGAWFLARPVAGGSDALRVRDAVPGDLVDIEVDPDDPGWGRLRAIVAPSPARRPPPCPLAGRCGGCHWLAIVERRQLALKIDQVRRLLDRCAPGLPLLAVPSPAPLRYRWRARLQVSSGPPVRIGFHRPGRRETLDVPRCELLAEPLQGGLAALREALTAGPPIPGLTGVELTGLPGARGLLLLLNPRDRAPERWPWHASRLLDLPGRPFSGVATRTRAGTACAGATFLVGRTGGGLPVAAAAGGFLQANLGAAERLAAAVRDAAGAADGVRIVDLFAGAGLLSWACAAAGAPVDGFERDRLSVEAARALPAPPGGALRAHRGDAGGPSAAAALARADVAVADPPRGGLGPLAARLARRGPSRLVLVSCSIGGCARDLAALIPSYRLRSAVLVDLFPQTRHVELVLALERTAPRG